MFYTMPAGATAVPVGKVNGKRQAGGFEFFYNGWNLQETIADLVPQETCCFLLTVRCN